MKSKWINEVAEISSRQGSGADAFFSIEDILERVDKLLRKAMNQIDNPKLYDEIRKEVSNDPHHET